MPARVALGSTDETIPWVPVAERGPPFNFGKGAVGAGEVDGAADGKGSGGWLDVVDGAALGFDVLGSGPVDAVFWGQPALLRAARQIRARDNRSIRMCAGQHSLRAALCARLGP